MDKSHAAGWGSDAPTPAQLKELFAQIESGRVTREKLQGWLNDKFPMRGFYADEEIFSDYAYPKEYKGPKPIDEQIKALASFFYTRKYVGVLSSLPPRVLLPPGAEGLFAIPRWERLAPTYGEAVEKVLAIISSQRKFRSHYDGKFGVKYLRQHTRTVDAFQKLSNEQNGNDILIVPAQFGLRHSGRSVRRARYMFEDREFGLGAFAVGIMLLTHPEREVRWEQLHVDCAGDELSLKADGNFSCAPYFQFSGGKIEFYHYACTDVDRIYGSASGFLLEK
ncbi:MAG: hypothetical protein AAB378_01950 [Patescibacteria group bacterium]